MSWLIRFRDGGRVVRREQIPRCLAGGVDWSGGCCGDSRDDKDDDDDVSSTVY